MKKILLIEKDKSWSENLSRHLAEEDMALELFPSSAGLVSHIEATAPDFILFNISALSEAPYEFCREVRRCSDVPLVALSARKDTLDLVVMLELGADDYLVLPLDFKELIARIKALLRRCAKSGAERTTTQPVANRVEWPFLVVDKAHYSVSVNGHRPDLPPKELELLYYLVSNPNKVFTREHLLEEVWGYDFYGATRTVDVHIKRIREKLRDCIDNPPWSIHTVWSVGYKFEIDSSYENKSS